MDEKIADSRRRAIKDCIALVEGAADLEDVQWAVKEMRKLLEETK